MLQNLPQWLVYTPLILGCLGALILFIRARSVLTSASFICFFLFYYLKRQDGIWATDYEKIVFHVVLLIGELFLILSVVEFSRMVRMRIVMYGFSFIIVCMALLFVGQCVSDVCRFWGVIPEKVVAILQTVTWYLCAVNALFVFAISLYSRRFTYYQAEEEVREKQPTEDKDESDEKEAEEQETEEPKAEKGQKPVLAGTEGMVDVNDFLKKFKASHTEQE